MGGVVVLHVVEANEDGEVSCMGAGNSSRFVCRTDGVTILRGLELKLAPDSSGEDESVMGDARTDSATRLRELVERAYRQHRQMVFHLALRYGGGCRAWAEDVTQEVFASLVKAARGSEDIREPKAWLYRATTNRCLNQLRRDRFLALPGVRWIFASQKVVPDPESLGIAEETEQQMLRALETLPPKVRVAFCMHHFDGLKQTEVANILGHSRGYVSKLIAQGEATLRALAGEAGGDDA